MALSDIPGLEELTRRPLRLAPNRVYRLWKGGALLDRLQGKPQPEDTHFPSFDLGMGCFNHRATGPAYVEQHTLAPRILHEDPQGREEILIGPEDTPCFGASRLTVRGTVPDRDWGRCAIGIVIEGRGWLTGPGDDLPLQPGTTLFLPAASRHHGYRSTQDAPRAHRVLPAFGGRSRPPVLTLRQSPFFPRNALDPVVR